jgi:hypothetical protein
MSLNLWRLRGMVSIHQASCLAIGVNPDEYSEGDEQLNDFAGFSAIRKTLDEGLYQYISDQSGTDYFFNGDNIYQYETYENSGIYEFDISLVLVKRLLKKHAISSEFFDLVEDKQYNNTKDMDNSKNLALEEPRYETKLLKILFATRKRYYSANFDPKVKDSIPSQKEILEWLHSHYELSNNAATSIDRILRYHG